MNTARAHTAARKAQRLKEALDAQRLKEAVDAQRLKEAVEAFKLRQAKHVAIISPTSASSVLHRPQPALSVEEPPPSVEEPALSVEEPALSVEEPTLTDKEPALTVKEPALSVKEPALSVEEPALSVEELAVHKYIADRRYAYIKQQKLANVAQKNLQGRINASISALITETNGQADKGLLDRLRGGRFALNRVRNGWMRQGFEPRPGAILQALTEAARVVEKVDTVKASNRDLLAANPGVAMMAYRVSFQAALRRLQWKVPQLLQELGSGKITVWRSNPGRSRRNGESTGVSKTEETVSVEQHQNQHEPEPKAEHEHANEKASGVIIQAVDPDTEIGSRQSTG